jgi:hypothetical protein
MEGISLEFVAHRSPAINWRIITGVIDPCDVLLLKIAMEKEKPAQGQVLSEHR